MTDNVYLVVWNEPYEGFDPRAVFTTRELAVANLDKVHGNQIVEMAVFDCDLETRTVYSRSAVVYLLPSGKIDARQKFVDEREYTELDNNQASIPVWVDCHVELPRSTSYYNHRFYIPVRAWGTDPKKVEAAFCEAVVKAEKKLRAAQKRYLAKVKNHG